jgi:FkbM family methyltransferase
VELGANDGLRQSNTLRLERSLGWRGLLIEPVVHRYFQLVSHRSSENSFECAACVPFDYADRWVEMEYGDLMTVAESLPGDLPNRELHRSSAVKFLPAGEHPVVFGARAAPLQELLDRHRAPRVVDFLSLDVEGAELQVLKGIDFRRTMFRYMLIETRSIDEIVNFLEPRGYVLLAKVTFHDYLFQAKPDN